MSLVFVARLLNGKQFFGARIISRYILQSARTKNGFHKVISSSIITSFTQHFSNSHANNCFNYTNWGKEKPAKGKTQKFSPYYSEFDEDEDEIKQRRESHWKHVKFSLILLSSTLSLAGVCIIYFLGSPKKDEYGNIIEDEFSTLPPFEQFVKRMLREIDYLNKMMRQPPSNKLLPDPAPLPYTQPKYTLVLEVSDLLVHADWTYQTGWRFKKRPGVDKFLELVTLPMFELVVFSSEQGATSFPLMEALDPNGFIMYRLGRDSTQFADGVYVKNLDCLNRDLSKVIVVDWSEQSVKFHRDNAVIIPRWTGQDDDTTLVDLAVFLRTIATSDVEDVRDVLSYYSQFENPIETFRENQRKLLEHMEEREKQERKKESSLASKWANTFLKNLHRADIK